MATATEYGLIAAGISLAIVGVVNMSDTTQPRPTYNYPKLVAAAPEKAPELRFTARESQSMTIVKDNIGSAYGIRGIVVKADGYWAKERVAIITCSNPKIDWATKRAEVVWFNTTEGRSGDLVVCN